MIDLNHRLYRAPRHLLLVGGATLFSTASLLLGGCGGGSGSGNGGPTAPVAKARIVFQSDATGNQDIYLMNGDGTGQVRITNTATDEVQPSFNKDASLITFRARRDTDKSAEIYVMNSDGTNQHAVTSDTVDESQPSFSPLNNTLVYRSTRNGHTDLYTLNLDTNVEKQLTNDIAFDEDPVFLPDGRVLFSSNKSGAFHLYVTDGTTTQPLVSQGTENQFFPDASKDGRVAFVSNLDGNFEIYVMKLDGTGRIRLTNNSVSDVDPVFSPDGTRIYYASLADGNYNLFVMNADGTGTPRRLTNQPSAERLPDVR